MHRSLENPRKVFASVAASAMLLAAICTFSARAASGAPPSPAAHNQNQETASVSGRVIAVSSTSFSLAQLRPGGGPGRSFLAEQSSPQTFLITEDTVIDGKLKVGATASVVYQSDDKGNNVAVSVTMTP